MKTIEDLDYYLMSNLSPKRTGLPFVVWVSPQGTAKHDVRVKVSPNAKAMPGEFATVSVRPDVVVLEGVVSPQQLRLLRKWIELNRDVLVRFWGGEIEYTEDMLEQLRSI
jgi:hypothetical protein